MAKKSPHTLEETLVKSLENFADALESGEDLAERFTCRKVLLKLPPTPYGPADVRETRQILGASQAIFAQFLGVSPRTVQAWEQGEQVPSPIARRFMDEIRHDRERFQRRFLELVTPRTVA
ncbi:MAG: hypothetical protein WD030_03465 [Pirellulales bacterium]